MEAAANIRFGEFVLNRKRGCLEDGLGTERFLRPKSYRVLEVLAERRGQLVSKDDLVLLTWPDVIVSDDFSGALHQRYSPRDRSGESAVAAHRAATRLHACVR